MLRLLFSPPPVKTAISQAQFNKTSDKGLTKSDLTMITAKQVRELGERIARQFQPERIILFGSYAYGTPDENSDVDLNVVMLHTERNEEQQ